MDEERWTYATISDYKPVENDSEWLECPRCGVKPRVWLFDNGRSARCCCGHKYSPAPARAESIVSVHIRTGNTAEYDSDALRIAWNTYISTGESPPLPEGAW